MPIHKTAILPPGARLPADISIGAYAVLDGPITAGPGTVIHAHAQLLGPLTLGANNVIHANAVIGGCPQDRKFKNDFSETIIGDDNVFREGTTIHRGTAANSKTVIGDRNYFMTNAHVGHNATVGNDVTFINGASLAGHASVGDRAILGAYCAVHQFCRIGRLAMISNYAGMNVDFPPFFLTMATNTLNQLNSVGLRRSGTPRPAINALRDMFKLAFREQHDRPLLAALNDLPPSLRAVPEVQEMIAFCQSAKRGVARFVPWSRRKNILHESTPDQE